jgi:hypothetical protein
MALKGLGYRVEAIDRGLCSSSGAAMLGPGLVRNRSSPDLPRRRQQASGEHRVPGRSGVAKVPDSLARLCEPWPSWQKNSVTQDPTRSAHRGPIGSS